MRNMRNVWFAVLPVLFLFPGWAQAAVKYDAHTEVELVSEENTMTPGRPIWAGLRMKLEEGWHIYWKNPGDSGLPPSINWHLPEGISTGPVHWPVPQRIVIPPLTSYGYEGEVLLPVAIFSPRTFPSASPVFLKADVTWLACQVICVPGKATLEMQLPVLPPESFPEKSSSADLFAKTRLRLPLNQIENEITVYEENDDLTLYVSPGVAGELYFYPEDDDLISHSAEQVTMTSPQRTTLKIQKSSLRTGPVEHVKGVLLNSSGWDDSGRAQAVQINRPVQKGSPSAEAVALNSFYSGRNDKGQPSIALVCLFAFLGGLILNLMPCVLPVLSVKVLNLIGNGKEGKKSGRHGLMFALGVLVSFWALGGILFILKSFGQKIGWGFQFQSAGFVVFIAGVLFILALNLLGLFEIGLTLTTLENRLGHRHPSNRSEYVYSFLSGVLTTIVATPCSAPFMGTAVGFALSQSKSVAMLIFTCLALGVALPFALLAYWPGTLKFIPKPGKWMLTLKTVLGFVLLGCTIWLVWVLGLQSGIDAVIHLLCAFLLLAVGFWLYGKRQGLAPQGRGLVCAALAMIFLTTAVVVAIRASQLKQSSGLQVFESGAIGWQKFSPEKIEQLKNSGKPFFVDFTAAWCLTCQVNDRLVFQNTTVVEAFQRFGVTALKADWTNYDEDITRALAEHGKSSVPAYVLYPGKSFKPVVLPEILTPAVVTDTVKKYLQKSE